MRKNRKTKVLAGLLTLSLVAGTLAYFSEEMSIDNPFKTQKYGGETIERFTPEDEWEPGGEVNKDVQAKNTGNYPLYVRVKFSEKWERTTKDADGNPTTEVISQLDSVNDYDKFFPTDKDTALTDGSSVYKNLSGATGTNPKWKDGGDGWYYYDEKLEENETTSILLDSVTLCTNANMGKYTEVKKYAVVAEGTTPTEDDYKESTTAPTVNPGQELYQKVVTTLDSNDAGLAGAQYTLTVTTQIAQADANAVTGWNYYPGKTTTP